MGKTASLANIGSIADGSLGFRNRIINGAMVIDQRNAGAEVNPAVNNGYYTDRWFVTSSVASKFKIQQTPSTTEAGFAARISAGFTNYLALTSLSAYTVGASESYGFRQRIEGLNVSDLAWGTASAATVTLSFLVYSSLTGTFGGVLKNGANDRSYPFSYSIPVANTWTQISITIAGDTSGTWLTTNGTGLQVIFSIGTGSTLSGNAGAWASANYSSATGAVSVVGTNGATFYITGVQLEKGSTATAFDYLDYGRSLSQCQRYFIRYGGYESSGDFGFGMAGGATLVYCTINFPVQMRSTPSVASSTLQVHDTGTAFTVTSASAVSGETNPQSGYVAVAVASGLTTYRPYFLRTNGSTAAYLNYSAEL